MRDGTIIGDNYQEISLDEAFEIVRNGLEITLFNRSDDGEPWACITTHLSVYGFRMSSEVRQQLHQRLCEHFRKEGWAIAEGRRIEVRK